MSINIQQYANLVKNFYRKVQTMKIKDLKRLNFKRLRESHGLNLEAFGKRLGIPKGYVWQIESGTGNQDRGISDNLWNKIVSEFGIPPDYLLTPIETEYPLPSIELAFANSVKEIPKEYMAGKFITVPLLKGSIGAGRPVITGDLIEDWAVIHISQIGKKENIIAIKIDQGPEDYTGMSMFPIVGPGDIVAIDRNDKPKNPIKNKIYAVRNDEGATLKYIVKKNPYLFLLNENKEADMLEPIDLRENPDPIIGRMIWCWKSFK